MRLADARARTIVHGSATRLLIGHFARYRDGQDNALLVPTSRDRGTTSRKKSYHVGGNTMIWSHFTSFVVL